MAATQKPKKAELHEKVYRVIAPLPFHAYSQQGLERENARLQKFVFKLERKFHETIWYIGMDMFGKEIYERFVFNHGGFMEIRLGESLLEAFFDNAHSAEKFKNALARVLCKFDAPGCARRIEVKEEFINLGRLLGLGEKEKRGKR